MKKSGKEINDGTISRSKIDSSFESDLQESSGRIFSPVSGLTQLKAIDTTSSTIYLDRGVILVETENSMYRFDRDSTNTENSPYVIKPTIGPGCWFLISILGSFDTKDTYIPWDEETFTGDITQNRSTLTDFSADNPTKIRHNFTENIDDIYAGYGGGDLKTYDYGVGLVSKKEALGAEIKAEQFTVTVKPRTTDDPFDQSASNIAFQGLWYPPEITESGTYSNDDTALSQSLFIPPFKKITDYLFRGVYIQTLNFGGTGATYGFKDYIDYYGWLSTSQNKGLKYPAVFDGDLKSSGADLTFAFDPSIITKDITVEAQFGVNFRGKITTAVQDVTITIVAYTGIGGNGATAHPIGGTVLIDEGVTIRNNHTGVPLQIESGAVINLYGHLIDNSSWGFSVVPTPAIRPILRMYGKASIDYYAYISNTDIYLYGEHTLTDLDPSAGNKVYCMKGCKVTLSPRWTIGSGVLDANSLISIEDGADVIIPSVFNSWIDDQFMPIVTDNRVFNKNRELIPLATIGNYQNTGINFPGDHPVVREIMVFVNGRLHPIGNGVRTKNCYFSRDGGVTALSLTEITILDLRYDEMEGPLPVRLYWNGTIAGFNLAATDTIDIITI